MGAIADAIAAYAQPLLDQTDGSMDQVNQSEKGVGYIFARCRGNDGLNQTLLNLNNRRS